MSFQFDHWEIDDRSQSKKNGPFKKVKYAKTCSIVLIPSKEEYVEAGIDLWYDQHDQAFAQSQLVADIQELMASYPILTMELAIAYLCQPQIEYSSALGKLLSSMRSNLDIIVVDKNANSFESVKQQLSDTFDGFPHWTPIFSNFKSGDEALAALGQSKRSTNSNTTVVLLDYNIYDRSDNSFLSVISVLRTVYGKTLLIGLCLPADIQHQKLKSSALAVGVDFVWTQPISASIRMLPLLLAARIHEREQTKIDFNSLS
mmetsp:Transcript_15040/g.25018  ORF Transcript_15040/g.25018 Transcript_15040/m.25018 type:complete len:259 (+) Transcript_15040:201-977(+)